MKGSPAEMEAGFKGFIAYFGTYRVDSERGIVTHMVAGSMFPN
jgi:hypothetical protein